MDRVIDLETLYQKALSPDAWEILLATGDARKAQREGGVYNILTGEIEAVRMAEEESAEEGERLKFYNWTPGLHRIRLLPPIVTDGVVSVEIRRHFDLHLIPQFSGAAPARSGVGMTKTREELEETRETRARPDPPAPAARPAPPKIGKREPRIEITGPTGVETVASDLTPPAGEKPAAGRTLNVEVRVDDRANVSARVVPDKPAEKPAEAPAEKPAEAPAEKPAQSARERALATIARIKAESAAKKEAGAK
jgi:hypothetical protein